MAAHQAYRKRTNEAALKAAARTGPGARAAEVKGLVEALRGLPAQIPEILSYRVGEDLGLRDDNATLALVGEFADAGAWRLSDRTTEPPNYQYPQLPVAITQAPSSVLVTACAITGHHNLPLRVYSHA